MYENGQFNVLATFSVQIRLGWNQVKYVRITITCVCFIALTLGPLDDVEQYTRDLANVNA